MEMEMEMEKAKKALRELNGACAVFHDIRDRKYQVWAFEDVFFAHIVGSPFPEVKVSDEWLRVNAARIIEAKEHPPVYNEVEEG